MSFRILSTIRNRFRRDKSRPAYLLPVMLVLLGGSVISAALVHDTRLQRVSIGLQQEALEVRKKEVHLLSDLDVGATSYLVFDITNGNYIAAKNVFTPYPLASITKVITAVTALELLEDQVSDIAVSGKALRTLGESGLYHNEEWNAKELLEFMLVTSSNDAAAQFDLQFVDFVEQMNRMAQAMQMLDSTFDNPSGLDTSRVLPSAYGSAVDVARMMMRSHEQYSQLLEKSAEALSVYTSITGYRHIAENTNDALDTIPRAYASKTGYTNLAGGNLVFLYEPKPGHEYAVVILGSTFMGRFDDAREIVRRVGEIL